MKFALIICSFLPNRLKPFLENFTKINHGIDFDLYFTHNCIEPKEIKNRYIRSEDEINEVKNLLKNFNYKNKKIIERENIGEDLGCYWDSFQLLKNSYEYFFFMNEATKIYEDNWLKKFYDTYEKNDKILAATPQICRGHKYQYCLPTTYWSLRTSFGKKMVWNKPMCRADAEIQEMELVYPQVKKHGGFVAQVGFRLMGYKNPDLFQEGLY